MKKFIQYTYQYDILPSVWRVYKTPGFKKVMDNYDEMTRIFRAYILEAVKKLEGTKQTEKDHEAGVLEKLIKIDDHVAFVMAFDLLTGGVDTTASSATSVLYSLARNSEKQEKLRKEILSILPAVNSSLTCESLDTIPYLRASIKEALRLYPPTNALTRTITQDLVLQGYHVPKGVSAT